MLNVDLRLYALLDPQRRGAFALDELARRVVAGGATLLQLRDKAGSTRQMIEQTRALKQATAGSGVPLLVNDRIDVALAADADGVHIGNDDMNAEDARKLLGPDRIIGLSVKSVQEAQRAPVDLLDYVCIGGVFATLSKNNPSPPIGVEGLRTIVTAMRARAPRLPIGAIAGIDESNAKDVMQAGVEGIAVISALSMVDDPANAARRLRAIVDSALQSGSR